MRDLHPFAWMFYFQNQALCESFYAGRFYTPVVQLGQKFFLENLFAPSGFALTVLPNDPKNI